MFCIEKVDSFCTQCGGIVDINTKATCPYCKSFLHELDIHREKNRNINCTNTISKTCVIFSVAAIVIIGILIIVFTFSNCNRNIEVVGLPAMYILYDTDTGYTVSITGKIKNNTDTAACVTVHFNIYSESGEIIGTVMDNNILIEIDSTISFNARTGYCDNQKPVSFKLAKISVS